MRPQEGAFPYVKDAPVRRIYLQIIPRKRHASQAKALCASPFSFNSNYKRKLSRKARRAPYKYRRDTARVSIKHCPPIRQGLALQTAPQHGKAPRKPFRLSGRPRSYQNSFARLLYMISSASLSVTGSAACGSVWYQYAVAATSDCCGRYRPPLRQPRS